MSNTWEHKTTMDRVLLTLLLLKAALFGAVVCYAPGLSGSVDDAPVVNQPVQPALQDAVSVLDDHDDAV